MAVVSGGTSFHKMRSAGFEDVDSANKANRAISWWWTAPETADDPAVDGLLTFCKTHADIVTTVIMRCGVVTCCRTGNYTLPMPHPQSIFVTENLAQFQHKPAPRSLALSSLLGRRHWRVR